MELKQLLKSELVEMDLKATTKEDVIKELVDILKQNNLITDSDIFLEVVMEREGLSTTGIKVEEVGIKC